MPDHSPKHRRNIIIGLSVAVIGLIVLFVILTFTVFKPKPAIINVNSVEILDLNVSLDVTKMNVNLNITLLVDLSVKNPNKVGFKYNDSIAFVNYRGVVVGEAPIPSGHISADQTQRMSITLVIMGAKLLAVPGVFSDVISGELPINSYAQVSGIASIFGVFKVHVVSTSSCDLIIDVMNRSIGEPKCKYQTKI